MRSARMAVPLLGLGLLLVALAGDARATDTDGDAIPDVVDNCSAVFNPPPFDCDTDQDGYGNVCDGDFSQNLATDAMDFTVFVADFGSGADAGTGTDMDCNGAVNANDLERFFVNQFQQGAPGPSGLPCAGTVPCAP